MLFSTIATFNLSFTMVIPANLLVINLIIKPHQSLALLDFNNFHFGIILAHFNHLYLVPWTPPENLHLPLLLVDCHLIIGHQFITLIKPWHQRMAE